MGLSLCATHKPTNPFWKRILGDVCLAQLVGFCKDFWPSQSRHRTAAAATQGPTQVSPAPGKTTKTKQNTNKTNKQQTKQKNSLKLPGAPAFVRRRWCIWPAKPGPVWWFWRRRTSWASLGGIYTGLGRIRGWQQSTGRSSSRTCRCSYSKRTDLNLWYGTM